MIDLHLHLDGSLSPGLAAALAREQGLALAEGEIEARLGVPQNCESLEDYLSCFQLPVQLLQSREATLTKLLDRCHNVSSMAGTFSEEKLKSYIEETRVHVLPMLRKAKRMYPEDADILFVLKYHIVSVVDSIDATIQLFENVRAEDRA